MFLGINLDHDTLAASFTKNKKATFQANYLQPQQESRGQLALGLVRRVHDQLQGKGEEGLSDVPIPALPVFGHAAIPLSAPPLIKPSAPRNDLAQIPQKRALEIAPVPSPKIQKVEVKALRNKYRL